MKYIPVSVTRTAGRSILQAKKNSPHIFFAGGVIGVGVSTFLACRATLKLDDTLDDFKSNVTNAKHLKHSAQLTTMKDDRQYQTDMAYVYIKGSAEILRLYAPSIVIGAISIGALTGSHVQLARRNTTMMGAFAAVAKAFDEYRERVKVELGDSREQNLYLGTTEHEVPNEDGSKEVVRMVDPNARSVYARFFDEYSANWEKSPELNRLFIQCQQNYANNLLQARGHVFLNEVYDMLGIERSQAGSVVGWLIGGDGDQFIDFGIFEVINRNFVNGWERSILLDFNVDGVIYDKI